MVTLQLESGSALSFCNDAFICINQVCMNFLFLNSARHGWGGNERSLILVGDILSANHHVVLAYRSDTIGNHVSFRKYRLPFLFEGDVYTIFRLARIVRQHQIDVIVPSKRKDYAIAGILSRMCGITNILWLGALRKLEPNAINHLVYSRLADGIIVNAMQIRENLISSGFSSPDRIKVLYRGIDSRALDRYFNNRKSFPGKDMIINSMGRLDRNKNHALLIRGFARFLAMQPGIKAHLNILGEGNERSNLEQLIREFGLEHAISLPGFISDPYPELASGDVFVVTSESEGISIALIEAMYLGNVPISTPSGGGVTEIIEHEKNGLMFDYEDEKTLASHLLKLYLEPGYRQHIAEAARMSISEKYAAERIEKEVVTFCNGTITNSRP